MKGLSLRIALPLLLLLVAAVYAPGLPGPPILDDRNNLAPLGAIDQGTLSAWQFVAGHSEGALFRPVSNASFLLDWWLWGDSLLALKIVNLLVHLLCGLAVFYLARVLLRIAFAQHSPPVIDAAALFACAMWLLAPLLVSTVLYTVQRMAQLCALFTLLGLISYTHGRVRQSSALIVVGLAVMWPLAVLSKENGALLPLLAALIEWWWLPINAQARRARIVLVASISIVALALLAKLLSNPQWLLGGYQGRDFTMGERVLTQGTILLDYLRNLLPVPGSGELSVFRDDYVASRNLWTPLWTLPSILFWLFATVAGIMFRNRASLLRAVGFGVLFFLCAHLVESSVFALELYFEHRNYLPAFGIFFALASCGLWMLTHVRGVVVAALAIVLLLGCSLLTIQRTVRWGNEMSLFTHATRTHPRSARAWLGLASVQFAQNQFDAANASLTQGARLMGPAAKAAIALQAIAAHCVANRPIPKSLWQQLSEAPVLGSDLYTINALAWMAGAFRTGTCGTNTRNRIQQILRAMPSMPGAWDPARQRLRDSHLRRLLDAD